MKDQFEERTLTGMRVVKTGMGCYTCHSETHPGVAYAVDILANEGLGSCTCLDFTTRRFPRWKGAQLNFPVFRCKHLQRVRDYVLDSILKFYTSKEKENTLDNNSLRNHKPRAGQQSRLSHSNPNKSNS